MDNFFSCTAKTKRANGPIKGPTRGLIKEVLLRNESGRLQHVMLLNFASPSIGRPRERQLDRPRKAQRSQSHRGHKDIAISWETVLEASSLGQGVSIDATERGIWQHHFLCTAHRRHTFNGVASADRRIARFLQHHSHAHAG